MTVHNKAVTKGILKNERLQVKVKTAKVYVCKVLCRLRCKTLKTPYIQILFVRGTSEIKINFGSWIVFLKFILTYYNVIVKVLPRNGQRSGCEQPGPFRFPAQQGSLPQGGDGILTELKKNKNI